MQKVQAMQRVMQEEPLYMVKPRGGHKVRETASTLVRDPNLDATVLILQELENDHEFLCAPIPLFPVQRLIHLKGSHASMSLARFTYCLPMHAS